MRPHHIVAAAVVALVSLGSGTVFGQEPAGAGAKPRVSSGVLTILSVKPNVERSEVLKVMPAEVRHTVELYLEGKILQWFGRGDGRGVVFILQGTTADDARAITDTLPLTKAGLVTFEYLPLSPLTPLQMLLSGPGNGAKP
jgi:hypothetical protein